MLEITAGNTRQWSRLGSRAVFGQAILALAETKPNLMVLSADLGTSSGLDRFRDAYPDRFVNLGIAEQNMIGVAAGLAKEGFLAFATSFAPFVSMRCCEQIRMNLGYMRMNVKTVGVGSGIAMGHLGSSHYGLEDVSIMRSIPNLTVVSPADCAEIVKAVFAAAEWDGPMYIRLTGAAPTPVVYEDDYDFEIGKAITLREGTRVTIIAAGSMVYQSLQAADVLESNGLSPTVINMHTIKPLDTAVVDKAVRSSTLIVTVEEHSKIGGLGSAVAEYTSTLGGVPAQLTIALPDEYGKAGAYPYLLEKYELTGIQIAKRIRATL